MNRYDTMSVLAELGTSLLHTNGTLIPIVSHLDCIVPRYIDESCTIPASRGDTQSAHKTSYLLAAHFHSARML